MKLGYARVSTEDQRLDLQRARLIEAGCGKLFEEKVSGAARQRPALEQLLRELRADDILVVTRLDRLARSTAELLRIAEVISEKNAGLPSLGEPWADTTTPAGRMVLTGALHGSLRHSVGGRDPQEGDDEDADNSFGRRGFGPRWADVAPAQARCGGTPVAGGGSGDPLAGAGRHGRDSDGMAGHLCGGR